MFPKDLELEVDHWAETGIFDADELHELHIQDNKLFEGKETKMNFNEQVLSGHLSFVIHR